jgi:hypothetical protein
VFNFGRTRIRGPLFISYRQSDGAPFAASIAALLRAAGFPVWQDKTDLPPGDTIRSIRRALRSGLSGSVLIVTPEIEKSRVVRRVELPLLLRLSRRAQFVFVIGTTLTKSDGTLDYPRADVLLNRRRGELSRRVQHGVGELNDQLRLVEDLLGQRMRVLEPSIRSAGTISIRTQSRVPARVWDDTNADLVVRIEPPDVSNLPNASGVYLFARSLPILARTLPLANPRSVTISGGMHLSLGVAIGMALPSTVVPAIDVVDGDGAVWSSIGEASEVPIDVTSSSHSATGRNVAVFVDLKREPSPAAFDRLVGPGSNFRSVTRITHSGEARIDPSAAAVLSRQIASAIRTVSGAADNATVHLALRCPFALSVLVGAQLNTVPVVAYEWTPQGSNALPEYVQSLQLRAGVANGPVESVLIT